MTTATTITSGTFSASSPSFSFPTLPSSPDDSREDENDGQEGDPDVIGTGTDDDELSMAGRGPRPNRSPVLRRPLRRRLPSPSHPPSTLTADLEHDDPHFPTAPDLPDEELDGGNDVHLMSHGSQLPPLLASRLAGGTTSRLATTRVPVLSPPSLLPPPPVSQSLKTIEDPYLTPSTSQAYALEPPSEPEPADENGPSAPPELEPSLRGSCVEKAEEEEDEEASAPVLWEDGADLEQLSELEVGREEGSAPSLEMLSSKDAET